jgi:hypothetical protein
VDPAHPLLAAAQWPACTPHDTHTRIHTTVMRGTHTHISYIGVRGPRAWAQRRARQARPRLRTWSRSQRCGRRPARGRTAHPQRSGTRAASCPARRPRAPARCRCAAPPRARPAPPPPAPPPPRRGTPWEPDAGRAAQGCARHERAPACLRRALCPLRSRPSVPSRSRPQPPPHVPSTCCAVSRVAAPLLPLPLPPHMPPRACQPHLGQVVGARGRVLAEGGGLAGAVVAWREGG